MVCIVAGIGDPGFPGNPSRRSMARRIRTPILLNIVLTRFCGFRYKGVSLLELREINHTGRAQVATPYSVSMRAPLSLRFIQ
jgi:hypothetical protein